jgi:thioredoxin reductase
MNGMPDYDVIVVGGGQSALTLGYFLRRSALSFCLLDAGPGPGGAWQYGWDSLRLFSPAASSGIAGWPMPLPPDRIPGRDDVVDYLRRYEQRYALPVQRPVEVRRVERVDDRFLLTATDGRRWRARAVISATGTWSAPVVPDVPGRAAFLGRQLHSAQYRRPRDLAGQRVAVVGGGNSGAQIHAELSLHASSQWITLQPPRFLPDDVDGHVLFERATARWRALQAGQEPPPATGGLGDIVMVDSVRDARARNVLDRLPMFDALTATGARWADGSERRFDAIVWCTGFRPALGHLAALGIVQADGTVQVDGTAAVQVPGLWLVGYGEWTGMASATLIGVTRSARSTVAQLLAWLG